MIFILLFFFTLKKNVPEDRAVEELINLIREGGDWFDPVY